MSVHKSIHHHHRSKHPSTSRQYHQHRQHFVKSSNGNSGSNEADAFLVFGYSAKLHEHREDEQYDESRSLIPWNGDDQLKIDRYDVRLYLNSLDEYDEQHVRERKKRWERRANEGEEEEEKEEDTAEKLEEELCEEERFSDMYEDIRRKEIEEVNQQKMGQGAEIAFTYEDTSEEKLKIGEEDEEDDEPYEKPEELKLPVGIVMPERMRQNALIERTAQFVVDQGPQMEVVIKAKQRQNAEQFGFLDFDHRLHPFYKFMCKQIREQKYKPKPPKSKKKKIAKTPSPSESDSDDSDGYLHPLLMGGSAGREHSPSPGFIGPSPRPMPTKPEKKAASPGPDLDALVNQFHRSSNENTLYSTLLKGLHSILPGTSKESVEITSEANLKESPKTEQSMEPSAEPKVNGNAGYETNAQRIDEYNGWHFEFYGRPSPYLPGPPPIPLRPIPDSAVESSISVAAKYVALHGAFAEQRLIEHNQDKVHFLQPRSPYYTFYQFRVRQIQWDLFQQRQQIVAGQLATPPIPPCQIANIIEPPQPELIPIKMPLSVENKEERGAETAEPDPKQLERREKARLFMEKILNERMAEKRRNTNKSTKTTNEAEEAMASTTELKKVESFPEESQKQSSAFPTTVSSLELSKAISSLIDEQIKRTLGTPSPKADDERERGKKHKKHEEQKKRRTRSRRRHSSSSDESENEKRRRRKRSRSGSRKRSHGRHRHGSPYHRHRRSRSRSRSPR